MAPCLDLLQSPFLLWVQLKAGIISHHPTHTGEYSQGCNRLSPEPKEVDQPLYFFVGGM